jgi:adenosylcobyric acid synthase
MNPVLLKPEHESGAQLIVRGQRVGSFPAREYWKKRGELLPQVLAAFNELDADLVLVEGAGSASEVNLRQGDIANFGFAQAANLAVILIGDIDRGGVIASLVGTFAVIAPTDAALVKATLVNKFRGDPALFADGVSFIAERTGVPCLGPIPYFADAGKLPAEDSLALDHKQQSGGAYIIAVPRLPRIANFDDLDPLRAEPNVSVVIVEPGQPLPQAANLILIPGSKATRADLAALRRQRWDIDILAHHHAGKPVIGICGGYQMLGRTIADPLGIEGEPGTSDGLGLLDVDTVLDTTKLLREVAATASGIPVHGYHMHMGVTSGPDRDHPFATVDGSPEGAINGNVSGTYLHGLFASDAFRQSLLNDAAAPSLHYEANIDATLDALAAHLEAHLDLDALLTMAAA